MHAITCSCCIPTIFARGSCAVSVRGVEQPVRARQSTMIPQLRIMLIPRTGRRIQAHPHARAQGDFRSRKSISNQMTAFDLVGSKPASPFASGFLGERMRPPASWRERGQKICYAPVFARSPPSPSPTLPDFEAFHLPLLSMERMRSHLPPDRHHRNVTTLTPFAIASWKMAFISGLRKTSSAALYRESICHSAPAIVSGRFCLPMT